MSQQHAHALEDLYRRRVRVFQRTLACVTGDWESAADAVQDGFAQALANAHQFRGEGSLESWVWRICLNRAHNTRRGPQSVPLEDAASAEFPPMEPDPVLADAIRALPPKRRLVVFLRYFADLSYEEISAVTGQRTGTVAATLNRLGTRWRNISLHRRWCADRQPRRSTPRAFRRKRGHPARTSRLE